MTTNEPEVVACNVGFLEQCSDEALASMLIEHLSKDNPGTFEDVANFCMMLHQRGAHPSVLAQASMLDVGSLVEGDACLSGRRHL